MRTKLSRNLVIQNGIVKCRIKSHGRYIERTSPFQDRHAYISDDGKLTPKPALLKWLADIEKAIANQRFDLLRAVRMRGGIPTVAEIIEVYKKECERRRLSLGTPSKSTETNQLNYLKMIVHQSGLSLSIPIDRLTCEMIDAWVKMRVLKCKDGARKDHALYVADRIICQAHCLFSRWMIECYKRREMEIPECVHHWPKLNGTWKPSYKDPPGELKRKTIAAAETLRVENPKVWVLYWLILNFGLRPGDALRLRWEHFRLIEGDATKRTYLVFTPHKTSRISRIVTIPVDQSVWKRLIDIRPEDDDKSRRIVQAFGKGQASTLSALNKWLRSIGWTRESGYVKASYELRKLFTSAVRNAHGVQLASDFSGSSVRTIERYYCATYTERMPTVSTVGIIMGDK